MCRPQVIERRDKWIKFGNVSKIARGDFPQGERTVSQIPVVIEDDEG